MFCYLSKACNLDSNLNDVNYNNDSDNSILSLSDESLKTRSVLVSILPADNHEHFNNYVLFVLSTHYCQFNGNLYDYSNELQVLPHLIHNILHEEASVQILRIV